jgi:hypothetical protein
MEEVRIHTTTPLFVITLSFSVSEQRGIYEEEFNSVSQWSKIA